jgi:hypothetical protein
MGEALILVYRLRADLKVQFRTIEQHVETVKHVPTQNSKVQSGQDDLKARNKQTSKRKLNSIGQDRLALGVQIL